MPTSMFWKNKKVFLTGHTGFKGSWAAIWLQSMGAQVTGYALTPETSPNLFEEARVSELLDHVIGDIRDEKKLRETLVKADPEIILHMAAQPLVRYSYDFPMETYETNVMGTAYLLQAARNLKNLKSAVIITTDKVYENLERDEGYSEGEALGGYDPYSSSKACAEIVTAAMRRSFYLKSSGAKIASARAGNVIGGGDWSKDRLIPDMVTSFAAGKTVNIRNPRAIRPWQHVLESVAGYLTLAEALCEKGDSVAQAWNFGPHQSDARDVEFIVKKIKDLWGPEAKWVLDSGSHPHEAGFLKLNIEKSLNNLDWQPRWNLDQALAQTVDWYKKFYKDSSSARNLCLEQISRYQLELK